MTWLEEQEKERALMKTLKDNIDFCPGYCLLEDGRCFSRHTKRRGGGLLEQFHKKLKLSSNKRDNYLHYGLTDLNGIMYVHQLLWWLLYVYVRPPLPGEVASHLDGDPTNNNLENGRWQTQSEDRQDAIKHGTFCNPKLFSKKEQKEIQESSLSSRQEANKRNCGTTTILRIRNHQSPYND